ncbi:dynamin-related protein 4C-like [Coffea arabica]|uniref:Dynamin-related protein 4C-like n=1 Tax=Coffea arabica TaxID=13443 RepID=A0ABM4VML3_COFAR
MPPSLPRGQGICTRVPLIMRLQSHPDPQPELFLEFNGKVMSANEENVADVISLATDEIAGRSKGISNIPLTLTVKKNGVPDLTMVDLPGITRVPVHGQPEDIYEQISAIIMEYIKPEESIILNVLSATVDFTTCESIRMSQRVDKTGERTLAVVTKTDKSPEGLLEKVTADDVNIGLGYVCVRNRIGNESYEEARAEEAMLFQTHPLLSMISESMVGIPVLAEKLVHIQATIISKCLPDIIRKINEKLGANVTEMNKLPRNLTSIAEAMTAFMRILSLAKDSLRKIFLRGEFDEYPGEKHMHSTARLAEMLSIYSDELQSKCSENYSNQKFLSDEISILEEAKGIGLPNFLPRTAFLAFLQMKVKLISATPFGFVNKIWSYVETVLIPVLMKHCENYPQLQSSIRRATQNLVAKKKEQSVEWVREIIEMEKLTDYTCNPEYVATWNNLMAKHEPFMEIMNDHSKPTIIAIDGFGDIEVGHLRNHAAALVQQAFDLKMRMTAYWKLVLRRLVDCMALHLLFSIQNLVNKEMEAEIIDELMGADGGGMQRLLEESPMIADKRSRLNRSIMLLKDSKEVVASIMDGVSALKF